MKPLTTREKEFASIIAELKMVLSVGSKELEKFDPMDYAIEKPKRHFVYSEYELERLHMMQLYKGMVKRGGTYPEFVRYAKYCAVFIKNLEQCMDWKRARVDFGIKELRRKYVPHAID